MTLNYSYSDLVHLLGRSSAAGNWTIRTVAFDSRTISEGKGVLFFAFRGLFRDGHQFIGDAYDRGVRFFVVEELPRDSFDEAQFIVVHNTLDALQTLATFHRQQFKIPVIGITGSHGKTIVKEWLSELLSSAFRVVRSPKSYNSRLGVALALLEINEQTDIAVIEAGIGSPGDMRFLKKMIHPTHGILTSIGGAHMENFKDEEQLLQEKISLFAEMNEFICSESIQPFPKHGKQVEMSTYDLLSTHTPFSDSLANKNSALALQMAKEFGISEEALIPKIRELRPLSMRLETFEGIHENIIINDAYQLDLDSLRHALEYQLSNCHGKKRVVVVGCDSDDDELKYQIEAIVRQFQPIRLIFYTPKSAFPKTLSNCCILFKGKRNMHLERVAHQFRLQHHQTYLEINLSSISKNIRSYKAYLEATTRMLCMVKASSYGSDARKIGGFLEQLGVHYLGVAYPDEGVELRNSGVQLPILVMNCEQKSFALCATYNLEPAIYSLYQLEKFIQYLITESIVDFPIHLKIESGMNRLGFEENHLEALVQKIKAQPEVRIQSIYSHLAESDAQHSSFTEEQIERFRRNSEKIRSNFGYYIPRHLLNSEGIANYPHAQFDMVRLGIGMYGVSKGSLQDRLVPALSWFSSISQIKHLGIGESVGYGRSFVAQEPKKIAVIPVGYADGFSRKLGNGIGCIYIDNVPCKTVGNVCMDMVMVDVTGLNVRENDPVEIIGFNQSIQEFSAILGTIPYEVMTQFSSRLHRIYIEK